MDFPPTRDFLDPTVLARLSGLPLVARGPMIGGVSGRHVSPHRGASVEFAEYRKYVPGDDLRRLDWRVLGRTDRYYVKEFEADTNLRLVVVVDTSGSMSFQDRITPNSLTKLDYAKRLAATISYLAVEQGDAVGISLVSNRVDRYLSAKRNPAHLQTIFELLGQASAQGETNLADCLHELSETIQRRAAVIVISDLFTNPESLKACFEHLRFRKHDVSIFHLLSPEEVEFPIESPTRFVDIEGNESVFAEPSEIASEYQRILNEYLQRLKQIALDTSVDYRKILINESYEKVIAQFLVERVQGLSQGRSSR